MDWNWSEHALWETTELFHTPIDGGEWKEPILDIDHPSGTGTDALYFIIKNVSDNVVYRERGSLSAQLTTSVERTEDV